MLTLLPGRPGTNRLEAWVTDADGAPLTAREATIAGGAAGGRHRARRRAGVAAGAGRDRGPRHRPAARRPLAHSGSTC